MSSSTSRNCAVSFYANAATRCVESGSNYAKRNLGHCLRAMPKVEDIGSDDGHEQSGVWLTLGPLHAIRLFIGGSVLRTVNGS